MIRVLAALVLTATVGGLVSPAGERAACDLPEKEHRKNLAGRDGAGLCVFASLTHCGKWHNQPLLEGMLDWMTRHPGGGWPEKVDRMIELRAKETNQRVPRYVHIRTYDPELLRTAVRKGYMVCVTYYRSPTGRYGGRTISHMVNLVHAGPEDRKSEPLWGILDNNYPKTIEWMNESEFASATGGRNGSFWAMLILEPPPPPRRPFN
ncbi:MAG: hypothetical protein RMJ19_05580 [Gemmatales bacterium]|nr:hypothetical protein [Gemmatales bacterium]MDW8175124.1 hypothetical protein [Gemmatales bacterium]